MEYYGNDIDACLLKGRVKCYSKIIILNNNTQYFDNFLKKNKVELCNSLYKCFCD